MSEIIDAQNTLTKLRQDIEVLTAKRSKLQNEAEKVLADYKTKLENDYKGLTAKLKAHYDQLEAGVNNALNNLKERGKNLSIKESLAKENFKKLKDEEIRLKVLEDKIKTEHLNNLRKIDSKRAELVRIQEQISEDKKKNDEKEVFLFQRKEVLDNMEFQAESKIKESKQLLEEIKNEGNKNELILRETQATLKLIKEESNLIKDNLKKLQEEKEENKKLLSARSDLKEVRKLKDEIENQQKELIKQSKDIAQKRADLREDEQSFEERQKLRKIESKKIEEKIKILEQIREEMKKSDA